MRGRFFYQRDIVVELSDKVEDPETTKVWKPASFSSGAGVTSVSEIDFPHKSTNW
jgi:hypothetical protein